MSNLELTAKPAIATRRFPGFSRKASPWDSEQPIREELFSVERLEAHAKSLAVAQTVASRATRGLPLAARLADNGAVLLSAYRSIVKAIDDGRAITPAAEWLIDNYHLVERQIRQISTDLPPGYYRQLPKLVTGPFAGYPRVFGMAWAFVAHTDSSFDSDILVSYVNAYQEVQSAHDRRTLGGLDHAANRVDRKSEAARATNHAQPRRATRGRSPCGSTARRQRARRGAGVGRFRRPRRAARFPRPSRSNSCIGFAIKIRRFTPALAWLDERLAKQGMTADSAVREVHRSQGAANVTVRNIVTSLRVIAEVDWQVLFERYCLVDDVLASGVRISRNGFCHPQRSTEARSKNWRGGRTMANSRSRASPSRQRSAPHPSCEPAEQLRRSDPGYHLLAGGRREFENSIGFRGFRGWPARVDGKTEFRRLRAAIVATSAIVLAAPLIALASLGLGVGPARDTRGSRRHFRD